MADRAGRLYNADMMKKIAVALSLALLSACTSQMSRTADGNVITVGHMPNEFPAALEHALELCIERNMNIRHLTTEGGAVAGTRVSKFECVKK